MQRISHPFARGLLAACALVIARPAAAQVVPTNPTPSCTVDAQTFAGWFQANKPSLNGVVDPANSVTFPNNSNCAFYQWSEQMFLWMTSPAPPSYGGGGGLVMDSPTFFDVSPPNAQGQRTFLAHSPNNPVRRVGVRIDKVGPHGLPIVQAKSGQLLEVEAAPAGTALQIRAANGLVPITHARVERGAPVLLDAGNRAIAPASKPTIKSIAPVAPAAGRSLARVRRFIVDGVPVFVDADGNVIQTEEGQAGGGDVLMSRGSKLIYYITLTNDVFAYFTTGVINKAITATQFPTTAAQLTQVVNYAAQHGRVLADANALAFEAKTSWVEADGLANLESYITMTATIPTYNTSSGTSWVPTGQRTAKLALLGVHVVGSAAGHPEMIWATFEHIGNSPNAAYAYINTANQNTQVAQTTAGNWLFAANNATGPFNQAHMNYVSPNINAISPFTITPSDTIRWKAWGAAANARPNPLVPSAAASNSEIIAINNSVRNQLINGDVRRNYIMIGSTWTINGAAPNGSFSQSPTGNEVGTSLLANSTMESYKQGTSNQSGNSSTPNGDNCFFCHTTNTTSVSHIYSAMQPLFGP